MTRTNSESTLKLYRILFLTGAVVYLSFWFVLTQVNPNAYDPLIGRALISGAAVIAFILSLYDTFFKKRIVVVSYVLAYILTFHYIFLLIKNQYSGIYSICMMTVLFGIAVVFKESLGLLIYLISCLITIGAGYMFVDTPAEDPLLYMSILITTCIISYLAMSIRLNAQKELRNKHRDLEEAYADIDLKHTDITDSINYAKKIQQAILPAEEELAVMLPNSFMLYKVKDIVSGDFFWYTRHEDEIIIAAVDCTGHGVPGALVSMIGITLLNQIVSFKKITKPGRILNNLQREIFSYLHRGSSDGMDIALCSFNKKMMQVSFAGATRPMIMIRDGILTVIKGERFSIGRNTDENTTFSNQTIQAQKGDMFYIFTDGYGDQFGGEKKKKFMMKRMKILLGEIHMKDMNEQRSILENTHKAWRGNLEQVDDILIIGFRI